MPTVTYPYGTSETFVVDKVLGASYQTVKFVASNMHILKHVSDNFEHIKNVEEFKEHIILVSENMGSIIEVLSHINQLITLHGALPVLTALHDKIPEFMELYTHLPKFIHLYDNRDKWYELYNERLKFYELHLHLPKLIEIHTHLSKLLSLESIKAELLTLYANINKLLAIYNSLAQLLSINANLPALLNIQSKMAELLDIHSDLPKLLNIEANLTALLTIHSNISALLNLESDITILKALNTNLPVFTSIFANLAAIQNVNTNMSLIQNVLSIKNEILALSSNLAPLQAIFTHLAALLNLNTNMAALLGLWANVSDPNWVPVLPSDSILISGTKQLSVNIDPKPNNAITVSGSGVFVDKLALDNPFVKANGDKSDISTHANAQGFQSISIGANSASYNTSAVVGASAAALGALNTVFGGGGSAYGEKSVCVGHLSGDKLYSPDESVSIGFTSAARKDKAVTLGAQSIANEEDSIAIGYGSYVSTPGVVSFGNPGNTKGYREYRRISNIEEAVDAHDAVNKGQLDTALSSLDISASLSGYVLKSGDTFTGKVFHEDRIVLKSSTTSSHSLEWVGDFSNDTNWGTSLQKNLLKRVNTTNLSETTVFSINEYGDTVVNSITASGINTPSSREIKDDIRNSNYGLETVIKLSPKTFRYKDDPRARIKIGFIAEEVEPLVPEAVSFVHREDAEPVKGLDTSMLIPILCRAIQELSERVLQLEKEERV